MLDNIELVETLENTKIKVNEVSQALNLDERTRQDIERLRDVYRSVARRGALLFFSLNEMSSINSMYQYALNSFLNVFEYSVKTSQTHSKLEKRLKYIIDNLTYNIYCYGTMGNISLEKYSIIKPNFLSLTNEAWHHCNLLTIQFHKKFNHILIDIRENLTEWIQWIEHEIPEKIDIPKSFNQTLNDFEKLMLLRCFRVDRIILAVKNYTIKIMEEKYIMPSVISFDAIYEQSSSTTPVIFVLSSGSDPTNDRQKLAKRKGNVDYDVFFNLIMTKSLREE
ncbi:unnamed protein product [Didymodactylos carnosus]|uniref:Uncharacterized protein n=1 Tax=Didymodactylos carnosus TaxID=1234261 RepID=A0A814IBL4_9BILA|nr:unnamed protein product [Didymodactylos carnosus]CAF3794669.1 unnamed protein product [Didymodactylos carnosus]